MRLRWATAAPCLPRAVLVPAADARSSSGRRRDLWITQDGYLAVTTPELATSILKLGADDIPRVAAWLRLIPGELMSRGIVRGIIRPPASLAGQAADPR